MQYKRIIAKLDIKNDTLVKGIHLEGLRVLGLPSKYAEYYYKEGIDEIIYIDVVASLYNRNSLLRLVEKTAKNIFVPLTVGGGIRSLKDVRQLLSAGADKVCINTAAVKDPRLITSIARRYGSSTVTVAIEAVKLNGRYMVTIDNGRQETALEVVGWAKEVQSCGAGEILVTNVDNEGTGAGINMGLISSIRDATEIPIIAHGGVGNLNQLTDILSHADAVCLSSILHYNAINILKEDGDVCGNNGSRAFIRSTNVKRNINPDTVYNIKKHLAARGILIRI